MCTVLKYYASMRVYSIPRPVLKQAIFKLYSGVNALGKVSFNSCCTYIQYQPCWCSAGFHKVFQFHYDLTLELKFQCKDFHSQATVLCLQNWNWQHLVDCTCDICTCLLVEHNSIKCKTRLYCIHICMKSYITLCIGF